MASTSAKFSINAERLLSAIQASAPLASKDNTRPHLTQIRFATKGVNAELSATDGHALGIVTAPLDDCPASDLMFCLQTSYLPTLVKALRRLGSEERSSQPVQFTVTRHRITVVIGDAAMALPNVAEQLVFPDVEKAVPVPPTGARTAVTTFGIGPALFARVMRAASHVSTCITWSSPANAESPIRFDAVDGLGGMAAIYVVMPMRMDEIPDPDDDEEDVPDPQLALDAKDAS